MWKPSFPGSKEAMLGHTSKHFVLEERHYIDGVIDSMGELVRRTRAKIRPQAETL
jgi:predicted translin family RNA/ssDNA-binding protein